MSFFSVILCDSLTNDFISPFSPFRESKVNLGAPEIFRLVGEGPNRGRGPLPRFLFRAQEQGGPSLLFIRDLHDPLDPAQEHELLRYGPHNLQGTPGADFDPLFLPLAAHAPRVETATLSLPLAPFRQAMGQLWGRDLLEATPRDKENIRFLLTGCHTDKRILSTAILLRHVLGFPQVAVCPHLVGSSNREAHFATLQNLLPDALVTLLPSLAEAAAFAGFTLEGEEPGDRACLLDPPELSAQLTEEDRRILQILFLRHSHLTLTPLKGGFSGSLLFLGQGRVDAARAAAVVVKIDRHAQIRKELEGYDAVKSLLGHHVPAISAPVSLGERSGIRMELASMAGTPATLQALFSQEPERFAGLLARLLDLLGETLHGNTRRLSRLHPFRACGLHTRQQQLWLRQNLDTLVADGTAPELALAPGVTVANPLPLLESVTREDGGVTTPVCLSHGDLNFANLLADQADNLWVIDWTHARRHPLGLDYAKLENDLKFVLPQAFGEEDLPLLLLLEQRLLDPFLPVPPTELPPEAAFIVRDPRFRQVYENVARIRQAYAALAEEATPEVYAVLLLKFAIHTLSFDARRQRGECQPPQLKHALLSVSLLLSWLQDASLARLVSPLRPPGYPPRLPVAKGDADWRLPLPGYAPPRHEDAAMLSSPLADGPTPPEALSPGFSRVVTRDDGGFPLNPMGRTGLAGRGELMRWGPNGAVDAVVTRLHPATGLREILLGHRSDTGEWALPGGFLRPGEEPMAGARRAFFAKTGATLPDTRPGIEIYRGISEDYRNTDHAWVETMAFHFPLTMAESGPFQPGGSFREIVWFPLSPEVVNHLFASHALLIQKAVEEMTARHPEDRRLAWLILNI